MMKKEQLDNFQQSLESITRTWWFILAFILLNILIPPIVTKGYDPSKTGEIIGFIFGHSLLSSDRFLPLYPIFKILPTILILGLPVLGNRLNRLFGFYAGMTYILFAVLQYISISDTHGLAVLSGDFCLTLVVALLWFWEIAVKKNNFSPRKIPIIRYWVVPLALLAFWYPVNLESMKPDFNLSYVFANSAGLAFCNMTPVYLAILTLYYPQVNIATLRITSLLGVIIGFWNMLVNFVIHPNVLWWNGVLHLPLVLISIYALVLSFRKTQLV